MNSKVCVVTVILFLSLENVSSLICLTASSGSYKAKQWKQHSTGEPEDECSKGTRDNTCNPQKLCHEWHQRYQNGGLQIGTANIQKWDKKTRLTIKVEKFDNNTELYCENSKEKTERPVKDKPVNAKINSNLHFDSYDDEPFKNLIKIEANETWENNEEPPYNNIIYSKENENISFSCPEPSNTTYSDAYQGHQTIIITTAVAVVFILPVTIVLYYITCKKRWRKKPQSEVKVLYADLDFLRQIQPDNNPRSGPAEECPYAQIIGEIRPQTT